LAGGRLSGEESGSLLIIGGNEDKQGDCVILRRFVAMAGGREARIALVTTATERPARGGGVPLDIYRFGSGQRGCGGRGQ
jgi:cyanophycinase-like exopeptidase